MKMKAKMSLCSLDLQRSNRLIILPISESKGNQIFITWAGYEEQLSRRQGTPKKILQKAYNSLTQKSHILSNLKEIIPQVQEC